MNTNVMIYVQNSRDIYQITEWLQNSVAKRIKKGQPVTVDHLAGCASMAKIIRMAVAMCRKWQEPLPTKEEVKEIKRMHAEYIIECANYNVKS